MLLVALGLLALAPRALGQGDLSPAPLPARQPLALRLNLSALSVGTEFQPLARTPITLMVEAGTMHGAFDLLLGVNDLVADVSRSPYPFFLKARVDARYYHNWSRRARLGRRIDSFSGNYISFGYILTGQQNGWNTVSEQLDIPTIGGWPVYTVTRYKGSYEGYLTLGYGLQRTFGRTGRWFYDFQAGVAYQVTEIWGNTRIRLRADDYRLIPNMRAAIGLRLR